MILRRGDRGSPVRELQGDLVRWGFDLDVDGIFGDDTHGATLQFQMAEGLTVDGIAGPKTLHALEIGPFAPTVEEEFRLELGGVPQACMLAVGHAIADLGKEEANGSNAGPEIAHLVEGYRQHIGSSQAKAPPWCGLAVCVWTAMALGLGDSGAEVDWSEHPFGYWRGSTVSKSERYSILEWARANDRLLPADGPAPIGSIFLMYRAGSGSDIAKGSAAGHTGLVVEDLGDRVVTVDGNVSNRVSRKVRLKSTLLGYCVWHERSG